MDAWEQYDIGDPVKQVPQPELDVQLLTVNEYSKTRDCNRWSAWCGGSLYG